MNSNKPFCPAEAFQPGVYIREELETRGWSQNDFAKIIGRPLQAVGAAFGTGPEVWINLQSAYDLYLAGEPDPAIARRARQLAKSA
jgi:HTH-type transcriptional regulator/antitoxin HigA